MGEAGEQANTNTQSHDISEVTLKRVLGEEAYFPDVRLGDAWGESISKQRAGWLEARLQRWDQQPDHGGSKGPFAGVPMSGADVYWLVVHAVAASRDSGTIEGARWRLAQTTVENFTWALDVRIEAVHLEGAFLVRAHLENAILSGAHLEGTILSEAHLGSAVLCGTHLPRAIMILAHMEYAFLSDTHLEHAELGGAESAHASFDRSHLEGADLNGAHLEAADLSHAHLEGANFGKAHLEGANLSHAYLDGETTLTDVALSDNRGWLAAIVCAILRWPRYGSALLADVRWNDVGLTTVDWSSVHRLGDEQGKRWWWRSRTESEQATRANVQLAKELRDAGLNDDADRFAYRAQVRQRGVHLLRGRILRWLFSWLLFGIAGYGYRPLRTLFWYLASIGVFAFAYFQATHGALTLGLPPTELHPLAWYEALVLSVSSFHGRGFFSPPQNLGDPVAILAAAEAVCGLFIEVSFIATFTQRYFGK